MKALSVGGIICKVSEVPRGQMARKGIMSRVAWAWSWGLGSKQGVGVVMYSGEDVHRSWRAWREIGISSRSKAEPRGTPPS